MVSEFKKFSCRSNFDKSCLKLNAEFNFVDKNVCPCIWFVQGSDEECTIQRPKLISSISEYVFCTHQSKFVLIS